VLRGRQEPLAPASAVGAIPQGRYGSKRRSDRTEKQKLAMGGPAERNADRRLLSLQQNAKARPSSLSRGRHHGTARWKKRCGPSLTESGNILATGLGIVLAWPTLPSGTP